MLPRRVEELTATWLTTALGRPVHSVTVDDVIWGTATKALLCIKLDDAGDAPLRLCVKGGFDERLVAFGANPAYALEANFFSELAPSLTVRLPKCWFAETESSGAQGIVILDDLRASGCWFGEPVEPWSPDLVASGLETLADLHGQTWGSRRSELGAWIDVGSNAVRAATGFLLSQEHWTAQRLLDGGPVLPADAQRDKIAAAFRRLWELDDAGDLCVAHGDAHVGNTFVASDGRPAFLDWQGVCLGPWSYDVAYFVGGALSVEDRRAEEQPLLRHYLHALRAAGGPTIDFDAAWLDYRRHALHGFLWAVTPPIMQPIERVAVMGGRHLAHMDDLESLALLA